MSHFIAERTNAEDTRVIIRKKIGDRIAKKVHAVIDLTDGRSVEAHLDELGLETVGSWTPTSTLGAHPRDFETVDVFTK